MGESADSETMTAPARAKDPAPVLDQPPDQVAPKNAHVFPDKAHRPKCPAKPPPAFLGVVRDAEMNKK